MVAVDSAHIWTQDATQERVSAHAKTNTKEDSAVNVWTDSLAQLVKSVFVMRLVLFQVIF